jgi:hypothetical protein
VTSEVVQFFSRNREFDRGNSEAARREPRMNKCSKQVDDRKHRMDDALILRHSTNPTDRIFGNDSLDYKENLLDRAGALELSANDFQMNLAAKLS